MNPDLPEDLLEVTDQGIPPPGVEDSGPGNLLARAGSVHCELCQGGCACGYDSSQVG